MVHDDIISKSVADLGCGTGRLAIGAKLLGADPMVGVEIDLDTLRVASHNAKQARVSVEWILGDIAALRGPFDTIVMNPPFGTKLAHNDKRFLAHAMQIATVVYSIHKKSTRKHMVTFIRNAGGRLDGVHETTLRIPRTFSFHRKKTHQVDVDLYRIDTQRKD